jgi:hypothetical protein
VFYTDAAATALADLRVYDGSGTPGAVIAGASVTTDAYSRLPLFWGPDGVDTLYAVVSGGPATAVYARADDRLDVLTAAYAAEASARGTGDATNAAAAAAAQAAADLGVRHVGAANGTDDTAWLNALLAAGGAFRLKPGSTYKLSAPLVLRSDTTLDLTGATLAGASGWTGSNMVTNAAATTAQRSVADAATTASSTTITSATAAFTSADVGRTVVLAAGHLGATPSFTATILSVTNGTTVVVSAAPSATVSGVAMGIYDRDRNITVLGGGTGTIDRGAVGAPGTDTRLHSVCFRRVDGLTVTGLQHRSTAGKYALNVGDVTNFVIDRHHFAVASDGVHVNGPARGGRISNLSGATGDDFCAIGASDYVTYADVQGDITSIEIAGLRPLITSGAGNALNIFVLSTGAPLLIDGITVKGIYGTTVAGAVVVECGTPNTFGFVDNIVLEDVMSEPNANPMVFIGANGNAMGAVTIRNLRRNDTTQTVDLIRVTTGTTLRSLVVDGITVTGGPATAGVIKLQGTVGTLAVRNADVLLGTSARFIALNAAALSLLLLDDVRVSCLTTSSTAYFVHCSGANTLRAVARGVKLTNFNGSYPWWTNGTITLDMLGVDHGVNYQTIRVDSATTTVRVRGAAIDWGNTNAAVGGIAGGKVFGSTFDLRIDLANATTGLAVGDRAWNTNAALSCGVGEVVCTGTGAAPNWKNLLTNLTY